MSLFAIPLIGYVFLGVIAIHLCVGAYVLIQNVRSAPHRAFFIFTTGIALWSAGFLLIMGTRSFAFDKLILYGGLLILGSLFHLALVFPRPVVPPVSRWWVYGPVIGIGLLIPFNLVYRSALVYPNGAIVPSPGPLLPVYAAVLAWCAAVSAIIFFERYRAAHGTELLQLRYFLLGLTIFVAAGVFFDALLPAFGIATFNYVGPIASTIFVALTAYAVVRHELMNITVVIKKGLAYTALLILLVGTYLVLVGAMGFFFGATRYALLVGAALTALVGTVGVSLLQRARRYTQAERYAKELEERVRERTQELREIQEGQARIMLDISHGLQTPLAVFQTKLEQLKQTVPDDKVLQQLETSLADVSNFIYNLLKLAHLENNREEVELAAMSLTHLLAEVVEEVETIAAARDITVVHRATPDVYIKGDAKKMRDVVMNLASNAIKYMRHEGIKEIAFVLDTQGAEAVLSVRDSGVGITAEEMPHIFERFYRVQRSAGQINGSGLGLAISKHLVEQHGGILAAHSEYGEGTTMTMRLPLLLIP